MYVWRHKISEEICSEFYPSSSSPAFKTSDHIRLVCSTSQLLTSVVIRRRQALNTSFSVWKSGKACSNAAKMLVQGHPTLLDATCWPHLNTMLEDVGLIFNLLKISSNIMQHCWANNVV